MHKGAFLVGCPPTTPPTPKASSPSGGGSWHVVPDGRGICKAKGTAVYFPTATPDPKRHPTPTYSTLSRLTATAYGPQPQSAYSPLPWSVLASVDDCGSLTPSALCPLGTRFPTSPFAQERLVGVGVIVGGQPTKRLLPLEGAVAVRRLRVLMNGRYIGSDWQPRVKVYRPQRLANTPYHQALRASFLPRWGKKPWGGWLHWGQPTKKAPLCKGSCPEGAEGLYLAGNVMYNPSVCPTGSHLPLHKGGSWGWVLLLGNSQAKGSFR